MKITASKVCVYEVELDLNRFENQTTKDLPGFVDRLLEAIPSLMTHECLSGQAGGFAAEMKAGTDLAHVVEHVILELEYLADSTGQRYSGWTRKRRKKENTYVIHYGARDYLTGRLAAILSVEAVRKFISGDQVDISEFVSWLKEPVQYFLSERGRQTPVPEFEEPLSIILEGVKGLAGLPIEEFSLGSDSSKLIEISEDQKGRISDVLAQVCPCLHTVQDEWKKSFLNYGGQFADIVLGKMQLLNLDFFVDLLIRKEFDKFQRSIGKAARIIRSYRIPLNFVTHSMWLYKNHLMEQIIEVYSGRTSLSIVIRDFDDLFQFLYLHTLTALLESPVPGNHREGPELKSFVEVYEADHTILVIDDDEMIRGILRDILEYSGYEVLLAKDAAEGFQIYQEKQGKISLTILDWVLPDLGGADILRKIKEINSDAHVLVATAYFLDNEDRRLLDDNIVNLIVKPFKMQNLLEKIKTILPD